MAGFVAWVRKGYLTSLRRYVVFRGRSDREELWTFTIAAVVLSIAAACLDGLVGLASTDFAGFRSATQIFHAVPCLALLVRRLHDLDRRGWWMFWPPTWRAMYRVSGKLEANRFGSVGRNGSLITPEASAPGEHRAEQSSQELGGRDAEVTVETLNALADKLRFPNWLVPFWFGLWISLFGAMLLLAGVVTAPNSNWWLAIVMGILALSVGISFLRYARVRFLRERNRPVG